MKLGQQSQSAVYSSSVYGTHHELLVIFAHIRPIPLLLVPLRFCLQKFLNYCFSSHVGVGMQGSASTPM